MKVGDLVKNLHALDRCELGIIIEIYKGRTVGGRPCEHRVRWIDPPKTSGLQQETWNSYKWLEKV
jgi:hypothetical protein